MPALKSITELIVRIADLAEAEGRELRKAAARLGLSLSLTLVAAVVLLIGAVGLIAALWLALLPSLDPAGASAIAGALALAVAGLFLWAASRINR